MFSIRALALMPLLFAPVEREPARHVVVIRGSVRPGVYRIRTVAIVVETAEPPSAPISSSGDRP